MSANGQLSDSELTAVQGAISLANSTARAWLALEAAARAEHRVDLNITSPAGGYRDLAMQKAMYKDPTAFGAKAGKVAAAGYSVHGFGRCVDIYNWAALGTKSLNAIAGEFGFRNTILSEPWHYQHDGTTAAGGGLGGIALEGEDMKVIQHGGVDYLVGRSYIARSADAPTTAQWREVFGESVTVEDGNDLNRLLWGLSIPNTTLAALAAHNPHIAAWEPSRGVYRPADITSLDPAQDVPVSAPTIDYDLLAQKTAARIDFPTTLTIDPPPATGTLS